MPINVPRTQVEDFTSRMDGVGFTSSGGFGPNTLLSSPMTGTVVFNFDVSASAYIYIRITDPDGVDYSGTISGWTRYADPRRYRYSLLRSGSSRTLTIPEGYQLTDMHIGGRTTSSVITVSNFTVTGESTGLIDRVWYNEWIAEVYQGRDLIYTVYNVVDTGFVWNPAHGTQYRIPELSDPLDIRVESNSSTTVRVDHVGRWEVTGTGTLSLTPEMSGRVLTFIGGSPTVHGLEEALPLYLISLTRGNLVDHSVSRTLNPPYDQWETLLPPGYTNVVPSTIIRIPDGVYIYSTQTAASTMRSNIVATGVGNETVSLQVMFGGSWTNVDPTSWDTGFSFIFGSENTPLRMEVHRPSAVGGVATVVFTVYDDITQEVVCRSPRVDSHLFRINGSWSFELGVNRWLSYPERLLPSLAVINNDSNEVVINTNFTNVTKPDVLERAMSEGNWFAGLRLSYFHRSRSHALKTSRLLYSLPRHEYES